MDQNSALRRHQISLILKAYHFDVAQQKGSRDVAQVGWRGMKDTDDMLAKIRKLDRHAHQVVLVPVQFRCVKVRRW